MAEESTARLVRIQADPIDVEEATAFLSDLSAGAHAIFLGTTRKWTGDKETVLLEYECFEAMALTQLGVIVDEAAAKWDLLKVVVLHRTGIVEAGRASVLIGAASRHRDDAFQASRYLIDELKLRAPIWKREQFADGTTEWVKGNLPAAE